MGDCVKQVEVPVTVYVVKITLENFVRMTTHVDRMPISVRTMEPVELLILLTDSKDAVIVDWDTLELCVRFWNLPVCVTTILASMGAPATILSAYRIMPAHVL